MVKKYLAFSEMVYPPILHFPVFQLTLGQVVIIQKSSKLYSPLGGKKKKIFFPWNFLPFFKKRLSEEHKEMCENAMGMQACIYMHMCITF